MPDTTDKPQDVTQEAMQPGLLAAQLFEESQQLPQASNNKSRPTDRPFPMSTTTSEGIDFYRWDGYIATGQQENQHLHDIAEKVKTADAQYWNNRIGIDFFNAGSERKSFNGDLEGLKNTLSQARSELPPAEFAALLTKLEKGTNGFLYGYLTRDGKVDEIYIGQDGSKRAIFREGWVKDKALRWNDKIGDEFFNAGPEHKSFNGYGRDLMKAIEEASQTLSRDEFKTFLNYVRKGTAGLISHSSSSSEAAIQVMVGRDCTVTIEPNGQVTSKYEGPSGILYFERSDGAQWQLQPSRNFGDVLRIYEKICQRLGKEQGNLDKETLAKAIQNPDFKGEEAQVLAALYKSFDRIKTPGFIDSPACIRLSTIQSLVEAWQGGERGELFKKMETAMDLARTRMQQIEHGVFIGPSPSASGVYQPEGIGSCYFDAALASLASINPQSIRNMIRTNGDGTYTVTFPGAPNEPIRVTAPTDAEYALYGASSNEGEWASIMRKAYGEFCNRGFWRRSPANLSGGFTAVEGTDGGSDFHAGLSILTGDKVVSDTNVFTSYQTIHERLQDSIANGKPITATGPQPGGSLGRMSIDMGLINGKTDNGTVRFHEYSVVAYQPDRTDLKTGLITVRNPWGTEGFRVMTLDQFCREFHGLNYAADVRPKFK
jgi:hypothetical protein